MSNYAPRCLAEPSQCNWPQPHGCDCCKGLESLTQTEIDEAMFDTSMMLGSLTDLCGEEIQRD